MRDTDGARGPDRERMREALGFLRVERHQGGRCFDVSQPLAARLSSR